MRWSDISSNPNSVEALAYRAGQLDGRARTLPGRRLDLMRELAAGKRVLDVGCVDHDFATRSPEWLHDALKSTAKEIVGVDYDQAGVEAMCAAGYDAVCVDITGDLSELAARGSFDLIVAGEVFEHVRAPQALLDFAPPLLAEGGRLVLTTPNPYAPWRVRNGQRGHVWENVDHVVYGFPAGMAELADRAGMELAWFGSIDATGWEVSFRAAARSWLGARRRRTALPPVAPSPLDVLVMKIRRGPMLNEQAVYCFQVKGSR